MKAQFTSLLNFSKAGSALAGALIVAAGVSTAPTQAQANGPAACALTSTLGALIGTSCLNGDKIYTFTSTTLPAGTVTTILDLGDVHNFGLSFGGLGGLLVGVYSLVYTIEIDLANFPLKRLTQVDIDSDVSGPDADVALTSASKAISDDMGLLDTIVSTAGLTDQSIIFSETKLFLSETFTVTGAAIMLSASNDFIQIEGGRVPEPATLGILGLGLAALGVVRRRKTR